MPELPREHYDYVELDDEKTLCLCVLCITYRATLAPYLLATASSSDHSLRCRCEKCRSRRKLEVDMLVADNKRTLWSECCFISLYKPWRESFLKWMEHKILNDSWALSAKRKSTNYFWVHEVEQIETGAWLEEWHAEVNTNTALMSADRILK